MPLRRPIPDTYLARLYTNHEGTLSCFAVASTPAFIKLTGGLVRDGNTLSFTVETIETPEWTTLEKFDFTCPIGIGARFLEQESIFEP